MPLIKFKQFESVHDALNKDEISPMDIAASGVNGVDPVTAGLIAERLNEKDFDDLLNEGIFDKLKNFLEKGLPGSTIRQADKILAGYKQTKLRTLEELGKERIKIFKLKTKADAEPDNTLVQSQFEEVYRRGQKVMTTIENAEKAKLDSIEQQLTILMKGAKKDRVKSYIDMKLAKLKEEVAKAEIEDAKAYTSDEQMAKLQEIVDMRQRLVDLNAKKVKLQQELDSKGGKKDGPAAPAIGTVVTFTSEDGKKAANRWVVVKDVWNGKSADGKTIDTNNKVPVIKEYKKTGKIDPDEDGTAEKPNLSDSSRIWIPITSIDGFEDFESKTADTEQSNAGIDKLSKEIAELESQIAAVKVWDTQAGSKKQTANAEKKDNLAPGEKPPLKTPPLKTPAPKKPQDDNLAPKEKAAAKQQTA